jgi:hypothetical protein
MSPNTGDNGKQLDNDSCRPGFPKGADRLSAALTMYSREHNWFPDLASALFSPHGPCDKGVSTCALVLCKDGYVTYTVYCVTSSRWNICHIDMAVTICTCHRIHKAGIETNDLQAHTVSLHK